MKKTLPFKYPEITSWTWTAATFAVLGNYKNADPWLYNNFVQLFCEKYDDRVSLHYIPHLDVFSNNPLLKSALINREIIASLQIDIIKFVKKCIDFGYYVYFKVDEGYICRDRRFLHELIIFGYDDKVRSFRIADFTLTNSQKYTLSSTTYQNIKKAYNAVMIEEDDMQDGVGGNGGVFIFSVNSNYDYKFDLKLLINSLEDYLNCTDSGKFYRTYNLHKESSFSKGLQNIYYGIEVYEEVIKYYEKVRDGINCFFIQPLHVLFDHKVLMIKRLEFLEKENMVNIPKDIIKKYSELLKEIEIIRNLGIKYWLKREKSTINEIINKLPQIKLKDQINVESLLHVLKKSLSF